MTPVTHLTIGKLLIANRGEIAARVIRTAHALGIATVAVYSDPDAGLPYVTLADEAVRLPGAAPADTYLRADLIIAAAVATRADAIHPGYGFLSEDAAFARACADAGLIFVGPAPGTIAAMGDKVAAKAMMAAAGVPVLPSVTVDADGVRDDAAAQVGFPLLVKAAFGGGGRGMRLVTDPAQLERSSQKRPPRGSRRVRRRHRVPGALRPGPAPRRGADPRRRPRRRGPPVRARVLHPAPLPEDRGGVPVPGRRRGAARRADQSSRHRRPGGRLHRRGHRRVRPGPRRVVLLPGDEHPTAGRAPGHRGRSPAWTWSSSSCASPRASRCPPRSARPRSPATPSRSACTPRTSRPGSCPSLARCTASRSRPAPACGWTPGSATGRW